MLSTASRRRRRAFLVRQESGPAIAEVLSNVDGRTVQQLASFAWLFSAGLSADSGVEETFSIFHPRQLLMSQYSVTILFYTNRVPSFMASGGGPGGNLYMIIDDVEDLEKEKRKPPRSLLAAETRS